MSKVKVYIVKTDWSIVGERAYFDNVNRQALMLFDGIRIDSGDVNGVFLTLEKAQELFKGEIARIKQEYPTELDGADFVKMILDD